MKRKIIVIALAAVMVLPFAACTKKQDSTSSVSSAAVSSVVSEVAKPEETETADTPDTPESPDLSQKEEYLSPFEFPYKTIDIKDELEEYGEKKGMIFNGTLTMQDAKSVVKIETRSAVNGRVLEAWCKDEIDGILSLAKSNGLSPADIGFNIAVYESSRYDGEYDITIYSK